MSDQDESTRPTLLLRLRDWDNREAWGEFLERYAPKIYGWCRRYELQESDAADVTQNVLRKLINALRTFEYDPTQGSFRGWLKTVTNNAIRDFLRDITRHGRGSGDTKDLTRLAAIQTPSALEELAQEIEKEGERELLREAEVRVQSRVKEHTWDAYCITVLEDRSAAEAAEQLAMSVDDIYVAKSRVLKMLKREVDRLNKFAF